MRHFPGFLPLFSPSACTWGLLFQRLPILNDDQKGVWKDVIIIIHSTVCFPQQRLVAGLTETLWGDKTTLFRGFPNCIDIAHQHVWSTYCMQSIPVGPGWNTQEKPHRSCLFENDTWKKELYKQLNGSEITNKGNGILELKLSGKVFWFWRKWKESHWRQGHRSKKNRGYTPNM